MPRPLFDSEYLYGIHDPGGEHLMINAGKPGWVLFTEGIGCDPHNGSGRSYTHWANQGLGVMVRLNNGYGGAGAIPYRDKYPDFARRCANYARASSGCRIWIIGNEPNHPDDEPRDRGWSETITPEIFAECYRLCRAEIHKVDPGAQVLVGSVAPYKLVAGIDFVEYFRRILAALGRNQCDGITLHTYTHGSQAHFIESPDKMGPPLEKYHYHFRVYQDFLKVVPADMRDLPCYITETNQTIEGDGPLRGWDNDNRRWVQRAYGEIDWWNKQPGNQVIRALILYRWSRDHQGFSLDGLAGIHEDFKQALTFGYKWPERAVSDPIALLREKLTKLEADLADLHKQMQSTLAGGPLDLEPQVRGLSGRAAPIAAAANDLADAEDEIRSLEAWGPDSGVLQPPIANLINSLPRHETKTYEDRDLAEIRHVVLHHSGMDASVSLATICGALVRKGGPGCPYHFCVDADGAISATQPPETMVGQSNKKPEYNRSGIAVALMGNFSSSPPGPAQLEGAANLIAWLLDSHGLQLDALIGRNEIEPTQSPGMQWLTGTVYKHTLQVQVQELLEKRPLKPEDDPAKKLATLRRRVEELQARIIELTMGSGNKSIDLMLLLWDHGKDWAIKDWLSAQAYIAAFRPVISFDPKAALAAKRVVIVGGEGGVSKEAEQRLVQAGVQVMRLAGANEAATNALLAELMKSGQPWPGAAVAGVDLAELALEDAILAAAPPIPRKRRRSKRSQQSASGTGAGA